MRIVLQRVSEAKVKVANNTVGEIGLGYLILVGFEEADTKENLAWIQRKVLSLRLFPDDNGLMNKAIHEVEGKILLVSQFTLHASTKKGARPSFIKSAKPEKANNLYESLITMFKNEIPTETGIFGANMQVELVNNGPVTIIIDSKNKE